MPAKKPKKPKAAKKTRPKKSESGEVSDADLESVAGGGVVIVERSGLVARRVGQKVQPGLIVAPDDQKL